STNPAIHYVGHAAGDAADVMQTEATLVAGTGSQTASLDRWGDYSSMSVDPSDDCTLWYTSEYLTSNGTWNWHTRIGSFRFPSCTTNPDFSLSASPSSRSVDPGGSAPYTITVNPANGFSGSVALSVAGVPAGATSSFSPTSTT